MPLIEKKITSQLIQNAIPSLDDPELMQRLLHDGIPMVFKAGDIIIDYGQTIQYMPIVLEGAVKVVRESEDGRELFLYYLGPGDSCAMSITCCLTTQRSTVSAISEEDSLLLGIPVATVDAWISQYPQWKNLILTAYNTRLNELIYTIDSIAFQKLDERLENYLHQKALTAQSNEISITHQEIANDLHASREAISRLLKQLENLNKVRLGRNKIQVLTNI